MQDGRASANARRGDETVQGLADRHTCAPGTTIKLRRESEVLQTVETQHRKCLQATFDEGSPPLINSTQRSACGESLSFRTSIQTLVSTTITSARDDSRQGCPPSGHALADRVRRCADDERPALATPRRRLRASSALRSAPGLRGAHGHRSRCLSSYTTGYTPKGVRLDASLTGDGGKVLEISVGSDPEAA